MGWKNESLLRVGASGRRVSTRKGRMRVYMVDILYPYMKIEE
jgi:hypothetical protein